MNNICCSWLQVGLVMTCLDFLSQELVNELKRQDELTNNAMSVATHC